MDNEILVGVKSLSEIVKNSIEDDGLKRKVAFCTIDEKVNLVEFITEED